MPRALIDELALGNRGVARDRGQAPHSVGVILRADRFGRAADDPAGLCGDPSRACSSLGWQPAVSFTETVSSMVDSALAELGGT